MTPLLEVESVTVAFGGGFRRARKLALDDVSLSIGGDQPSITAIVGESGSGKTTLTRLLLGLLAPSGGIVRYRGGDLAAMDGQQRFAFRREVQAIFQDPFDAYNPFYRIDRVLTEPLASFGLAKSRGEADGLIERSLEAVGLRPKETLGRYPHELSGGQRQRVMIARALLVEPRVLIADEPVSMVDASLRATILECLYRLKVERGISLVYVTHDLTTAYQVADRVVVLYAGRIAEDGAAEDVIKRPKHPYTRELIEAIPLPDPDRPWGLGDDRRAEAAPPAGACAFAGRCREAMARCRAERPELRDAGGQFAACFLYDAAVTLTDARHDAS
jgi:peptide/nickel transport system ATP-binding protein